MLEFGILGSGFGLYGYLPAVVKSGHKVVIPRRYETALYSRPELTDYRNSISFESETQLVRDCKNIILALDPDTQYETILNSDFDGKRLWLEKPLAPSIIKHQEVVELIKIRGYQFSIGYLFRFTNWWGRIVNPALGGVGEKFSIYWEMPAPMGWKNSSNAGGGIVSFYAIHFAPLMLDDMWILEKSEISKEEDRVKFFLLHKSGSSIQVEVNYGNRYSFDVLALKKNSLHEIVFKGTSPFGDLPLSGIADPRLPFLCKYLNQGLTNSDQTFDNLALEQIVIDFRKSFL